MCGVFPLGKWKHGGGRLLLWTIGARIDARDGDAVFFDSRLILHSVEAWEPAESHPRSGRSSLVGFCKAKVGNPTFAPWPASARYDARYTKPLSEWF